jgi:hypothetical protein
MRRHIALRVAAAVGTAALVLTPAISWAHGDGSHLVSADAAPTVTAEVSLDPAGDGINVHLTTTKFTFTPEKSGDAYVEGEGHAHLMIDGNQVGRAYGEWTFVPIAAFGSGEHTLEVSLEASDHQDYMIGDSETSGEDVGTRVGFVIPAGLGLTSAAGHDHASGSSGAWLWGLAGLLIGGGVVAAVFTARSRALIDSTTSR